MALKDLFTTSVRYDIADDGGAWRQYVLDHIDYIKSRSDFKLIDPHVMALYRYDLDRFLSDELRRGKAMAWIVLLINDMRSDFEFVETEKLYVPSDTLISDLYKSYVTITSNT